MLRKWIVALGLVGAVGLSCLPAIAQQAPAPDKPKEAAVDPISGNWDGTVQMKEGPREFHMALKLDKDAVSGDIGNDQGNTPVTGTWTDGKLTLSFSYVNGEPCTLTGTIENDQLGGQLDIDTGKVTATWTAKKKA